jgi:lipopolysaccharide transport system permease protein
MNISVGSSGGVTGDRIVVADGARLPVYPSGREDVCLVTTLEDRPRPHPIVPAREWPVFGFGELWRTRRILLVLSQRILKVRYQQTALGIVWVILQPLALVIIVSVFLGLVIARGQRLDLPFPAFLFPAWVVWRIFSKVISEGGNSVLSNGALVQRIYLPRVFFPLAIALSSLVDLFFLIVAMLVMLFIYGIVPGVGVLMLPVALAIMYAAAVGTAFLFGATSPQYRDMDILVPLITQAWFWMSPIIYPSQSIPENLRAFFYLNPVAVVIDTFRWAFTGTPHPPLEAYVAGASVAALLLVVGFIYFRRREPLFADWLGE